MVLQWHTVGALAVLGCVLLLAVSLPSPRGLIWAPIACASLFCAGLAACVTAIAMPALGLWDAVLSTALYGLSAMLLAKWFAVSTDERGDEDEDGGGGWVPSPDEPASPTDPGGIALPIPTDWSAFDAARARWERDRTPGPR